MADPAAATLPETELPRETPGLKIPGLPFPLSREILDRLTPTQKIGGLVALAAAIAMVVGLMLWSKAPEYSVLFSNISDRDGGQIVTSLQQMNVPYQYSANGTTILVPAAQVHDVRLRLATQGLPKGGLVGFEVMESQKLGSSQFLEQINYQRALEGELARSIQTLQAVEAARVHLAIPKPSAFLRNEQKPTASVVLTLLPGRSLDASQVAGIVHLVASSVPQLTPGNISVIDQNGELISKNNDLLRNNGLDPSQFKYVQEIERTIIKRIETILEPVTGPGNLRAQVAADVDFSQTEQTAETYTPNPPPNTAIRSQQTSESSSSNPGPMGVPGALSNQPPVPATAPITDPSVPGGATAAGQPLNQSRNSTTNYELDKTIRHTKGSTGNVRRLSVAVVVNYKPGTPDKQGNIKPLPLSAEELQQINQLVREAMGYNQERGDTLNVANVAFNEGPKEEVQEIPLWKNPEAIAVARDNAKYVVVALLALLVWYLTFRPIFKAWAAAAEEQRRQIELANQALEEDEEIVDDEEAEELAKTLNYEAKLADVRELAKNDPRAIAYIISTWINAS